MASNRHLLPCSPVVCNGGPAGALGPRLAAGAFGQRRMCASVHVRAFRLPVPPSRHTGDRILANEHAAAEPYLHSRQRPVTVRARRQRFAASSCRGVGACRPEPKLPGSVPHSVAVATTVFPVCTAAHVHRPGPAQQPAPQLLAHHYLPEHELGRRALLDG